MKNRYLILGKQALILASCSSAIFTVISLLKLLPPHATLSQYVIDENGYWLFNIGFFVTALGFFTDIRYYLNGSLLLGLLVFNTYEFSHLHNIFALGFFGLSLVQSYTTNKTQFVLLLAAWIVLPFSMMSFEVSSIFCISYFMLKTNRIV